MPWKIAFSGLFVVLTAISGCSSTSESTQASAEPAPADASGGDLRCNASAAQYAVGKVASPALLDEAKTKSGAGIARVLTPSDMVTLEYRSERLNLNTDDSLKVIRVNCG